MDLGVVALSMETSFGLGAHDGLWIENELADDAIDVMVLKGIGCLERG